MATKKKTFKKTYQLKQLKCLEPTSHRAALVALRGGFVVMASEIVRRGMHIAFDRLIKASQPQPAQTSQEEQPAAPSLGICIICNKALATVLDDVGPLCDACYNGVNEPTELDSNYIPFSGEAVPSPDAINESDEYGLQPPF